MARSLLFDLRDPEEGRAAVVEDGRLAELAVESRDRKRLAGDVVLGRVVRLEPSVQAAFVDIGADRPGFLHAGDVMPLYADRPEDLTAFEKRPRGASRKIGDLLREGQKVLVQVTRDALGRKGSTLTTYVSIPGRWLVLMPALERLGVSRKITDPEARDRAREALASLEPPPGMGFIVRTAGADRPAAELRRDLDALKALWRGIGERCLAGEPPATLVREGSLLVRTLRDWLAAPVDEVLVEGKEGFREARDFLAEASPPWAGSLRLHDAPVPLFHAKGIEAAADRVLERRVPLPSGGFLVIDPTEALVAVDVNSGSSTGAEDLEQTALHTDLEAAAELARQLRLRDLGGVIVVDFIDLREAENRAAVDRAVAEALRDDRARIRLAPMGEFGLVAITRRRQGPSLAQLHLETCPVCRGRGAVRTPASAGLRALREARALLGGKKARGGVEVRAHPEVAAWLRAHKAEALEEIRGDGREVRVEDDPTLPAGAAQVASLK